MRISVVTPSFNQGLYIERTIQSVIGQKGDFELDYIIIDGGSNDSTLDTLKKYSPYLTWRSESDQGQSDAINKGLRMAKGDILAWLNSDDTYESGALQCIADAYKQSRFYWGFGDCRIMDESDRTIRHLITWYKISQSKHYSYKRLLRRDFISQPAAFFSRQAYEEVGEIDPSLYYSMDYDYWLKLGKRHPPLYINRFLANFRWYTMSKNVAAYRRAAWETYQTARKHASSSDRFDVAMHYVHYWLLSLLYRIL
jgi:glycosyltransferase involved in cell wall biosynthesis